MTPDEKFDIDVWSILKKIQERKLYGSYDPIKMSSDLSLSFQFSPDRWLIELQILNRLQEWGGIKGIKSEGQFALFHTTPKFEKIYKEYLSKFEGTSKKLSLGYEIKKNKNSSVQKKLYNKMLRKTHYWTIAKIKLYWALNNRQEAYIPRNKIEFNYESENYDLLKELKKLSELFRITISLNKTKLSELIRETTDLYNRWSEGLSKLKDVDKAIAQQKKRELNELEVLNNKKVFEFKSHNYLITRTFENDYGYSTIWDGLVFTPQVNNAFDKINNEFNNFLQTVSHHSVMINIYKHKILNFTSNEKESLFKEIFGENYFSQNEQEINEALLAFLILEKDKKIKVNNFYCSFYTGSNLKDIIVDFKNSKKQKQETSQAKTDNKHFQQAQKPLHIVIDEIKTDIRIRGFEEKIVLPKPKNKKIQLRKFPAGLKWEEISIQFLNEHEVIVKAKDETLQTTYEAMGFQDEKKKLPNKQWQFLSLLAIKNGEISWENNSNLPLKQINSIKKQKQLLSEALKAYFQIYDSEPFNDYKKEKAYRIKITLTPEPKLKDKDEREVYDE